MSRIAFVWELGTAYGHISRLLPFARKLKQRGHDVVLLLRELHNTGNLHNEGIPVLQAPVWLPETKGLRNPPLNFSEILLRYGYLNSEGLTGLVGAWRGLFELHGSDLIVADHAPTALLAARSMGLIATTLGTGFHLPPNQTPLPNMRPWLKVPLVRLENSDATVLKNINATLATYQAEPLTSMGDLFKIEEHFLCTFPELDHYPQRGQSAYWGATSNTKMGQDVAWPDGMDAQSKRIFVYLEPHTRDFGKVLETLSALGHRAIICAPGLSDKLCRQYANPRTIISSKPFRIDALLADCDLVIGNAGHGMTAGMLLAGVPQLLFPTHLERFLLASRVAAMGAGIAVSNEGQPPDYAAVINRLLEVPGYRESARRFAKKYANFNQAEQQGHIIARIEKIATEKIASRQLVSA